MSWTIRWHLLVAVVGSLLLVVVLELAGNRPRPAWFVALGLAIGFGSLALRLMFQQVLESSWPTPARQATIARSGISDKRTRFLATWIQTSSAESRPGQGSFTFAHQIQPLLFELARDRLIHRHSVDPEAQPDVARELAGESLWALATDDRPRVATFTELESAVRAIEEL